MAANVSFALLDFSDDDDLTTAVDCKMGIPLSIQCPGALTSSVITVLAAAEVTDQDGTAFTTYGNLKDTDGTDITFTFAANAVFALHPKDWAGVKSFKLSLDGTESADSRFAVVWRDDS